MTVPRPPVLEVTNVSKSFGGVRALDSVDFSVRGGEVHALLGQNGSGKSTLVKILTGYHAPEEGATITLWETVVAFPIVAPHEHGIAVIHQDLGLVESMTVFENLGVASRYGTRLLLPIRSRSERRRWRHLLDEVQLDVGLDTLVRDLSPAQRAAVAIARARRTLREHGERHLFVVDEPTTYLDAAESRRMLDLIRSVAAAGSSVIFVTHSLQEALSVADAVTVLRDGRVADRFFADDANANENRIITAMLGRDLDRFYPDRAAAPFTDTRLEVVQLGGRQLDHLSLTARRGEVIGLAGLVGSGHEDVPYLISGAREAVADALVIDGEDIRKLSFAERLARGVVLIPGNRQRDGLWLRARAWENITLSHLARYRRAWGLQLTEERRSSTALMERFGVRPPLPEAMTNEFSGGNQQKIVLAKWLHERPKLLLLDEPTQGIDAGAKRDILDLIVGLAEEGTTVLIASGDYEQLAHICTRVLVIRHGWLVAELQGDEISESRVAEEAHGGRLTAVNAASTTNERGHQ